jgi:hypothetical protein
MAHVVVMVGYEGSASAPEGDPPRFTIRADSDEVVLLDGDPAAVPVWVKYETEVIMTGETTLREHGTMILGHDADRLRVATVGEGLFLPTPEEGVMHGTVMWRVEQGEGRFSGATGLVTGNFTHYLEPNRGREFQVLNLFLP